MEVVQGSGGRKIVTDAFSPDWESTLAIVDHINKKMSEDGTDLFRLPWGRMEISVGPFYSCKRKGSTTTYLPLSCAIPLVYYSPVLPRLSGLLISAPATTNVRTSVSASISFRAA